MHASACAAVCEWEQECTWKSTGEWQNLHFNYQIDNYWLIIIICYIIIQLLLSIIACCYFRCVYWFESCFVAVVVLAVRVNVDISSPEVIRNHTLEHRVDNLCYHPIRDDVLYATVFISNPSNDSFYMWQQINLLSSDNGFWVKNWTTFRSQADAASGNIFVLYVYVAILGPGSEFGVVLSYKATIHINYNVNRLYVSNSDGCHCSCTCVSQLNDTINLTYCEVGLRSEEHTSELQSRPHISYAVFCLKKKKKF